MNRPPNSGSGLGSIVVPAQQDIRAAAVHRRSSMKEILATLAVIILGAACVDRETYTERLEGVPLLLGEFTSYATEAHVRAQLGSRQVQTLERGGTRAAEGRPPFEIAAHGGEVLSGRYRWLRECAEACGGEHLPPNTIRAAGERSNHVGP
jgi:hypothetical protein